MADPTMVNAIKEVEKIIAYHFKTPALLSEALQSSSTPFPRSTNQPSLALSGQRALEAISWQLFWGEYDAKDVTLGGLDRGVEFRQELDGDANLLRIANRSRLYLYIATGIGVVSSRVRAILGAVWLDSERNLEQVKDVMRVLGFMPEQKVLAIRSA